MEVDGVAGALPVAKAAGGEFYLLDLGVERFAARIGDAVAQGRNDILDAAFHHAQKALDG